MNLKNKKIYIFGGNGRIGRELVENFIKHDASLIVFDKNISDNLSFQNNPNCRFIEIHSDEVEEAEMAITDAVENFGCPDVFINCSYPRTEDWADNSFESISLKSMRRNIDIHLNGYIWLAKKVADFMREHSKHGSIILTSSIYGLKAQDQNLYKATSMSENLTYAIIKAGIIHGVRQMASYYGEHNLRINSICPGGINDQSHNKKFVERYSSKTALKRMADPSDIIGAYLFLSSDYSNYVTGESIIVDGGFSIT